MVESLARGFLGIVAGDFMSDSLEASPTAEYGGGWKPVDMPLRSLYECMESHVFMDVTTKLRFLGSDTLSSVKLKLKRLSSNVGIAKQHSSRLDVCVLCCCDYDRCTVPHAMWPRRVYSWEAPVTIASWFAAHVAYLDVIDGASGFHSVNLRIVEASDAYVPHASDDKRGWEELGEVNKVYKNEKSYVEYRGELLELIDDCHYV